MFSPSAFYAHFVLSQLFPLNSTILVISLKRKYESLPDVLKVAIWYNFNSTHPWVLQPIKMTK